MTKDIIDFNDKKIYELRMVERRSIFANADLNSNGYIDRSEFDDFQEKIGQSAGSRGVPYMFSDDVSQEMKRRTFDLYNSYNEEIDGVTLDDFNAVTLIIYDKMRELASQ